MKLFDKLLRAESKRFFIAICFMILFQITVFAQAGIELKLLGSYDSGIFGGGAAEIVAHDPETQRLFVVNGANKTIDVLDASDPANPVFAFAIDITPFGGNLNSVDVKDGVVAAAVEADNSSCPVKSYFSIPTAIISTM